MGFLPHIVYGSRAASAFGLALCSGSDVGGFFRWYHTACKGLGFSAQGLGVRVLGGGVWGSGFRAWSWQLS